MSSGRRSPHGRRTTKDIGDVRFAITVSSQMRSRNGRPVGCRFRLKPWCDAGRGRAADSYVCSTHGPRAIVALAPFSSVVDTSLNRVVKTPALLRADGRDCPKQSRLSVPETYRRLTRLATASRNDSVTVSKDAAPHWHAEPRPSPWRQRLWSPCEGSASSPPPPRVIKLTRATFTTDGSHAGWQGRRGGFFQDGVAEPGPASCKVRGHRGRAPSAWFSWRQGKPLSLIH